MRSLLAVLPLLGALAASAGETPEARSAREKLEAYARPFEIRLIPLQQSKSDHFVTTNKPYADEKYTVEEISFCFRDGVDFDGPCKHGMYLTPARSKAVYEQANKTDGKLDHRKGARWFCGLVDASRAYFHHYAGTTYYGTPPQAVAFVQSVTNAEAKLLKEAYGIDFTYDVHYTLPQCEEELVEELKRTQLIPKETGPDEHHPREAPPAEPREPDVTYRTVDDLRRLQGEGNRFVWFGGTLWGTWTKDIDTLALLLDCRGPRWVGTFVGVVPRDSEYTGGSRFGGRAVRHHAQPSDYKAIDWDKVKAPERKRACRELSRKLKR